MEINSKIIFNVISFIGGGGLLWLFNSYIKLRQDKREDKASAQNEFKVLQEGLMIEFARLNTRIGDLEKDLNEEKQAHTETKQLLFQFQNMVEKLGDSLIGLQTEIGQMGLVENDSPIPMWRKSKDGMMLDLNKPYETMFLKPNGFSKAHYVGKTDVQMWGEEIGNEYARGDSEAINKRDVITFLEKVKFGSKIYRMWIVKWPVFSGSEIIGVQGLAIPKTEINADQDDRKD